MLEKTNNREDEEEAADEAAEPAKPRVSPCSFVCPFSSAISGLTGTSADDVDVWAVETVTLAECTGTSCLWPWLPAR